jgi:phenylacetate-CoA ligase
MSSVAERIYLSAPSFAQKLLLDQFGRRLKKQRFGKQFRDLEAFLDESQWYGADDIKRYQERQFLKLARHAFHSVPFYNNWARSAGLSVDHVRSIEDLDKFPIIDKTDILNDPKEFISSAVDRSQRVHGHTSGTTGSPLDLWYSPYNVIFTAAVDWRQKRWAGLCPKSRGAFLLGRTVVKPTTTVPPFGHYIKPLNQLWLSSFHLSEDRFPWFAEALKRYEIEYVEGYPSTLATLAAFAERAGVRLPMQAALTSSETLYDHQREMIERVFECKLYDFFGLAERTAFGTECHEGQNKHLNFEYAINEIVDENGASVAHGKTGYLVGTSLTNFVMPLIRYKVSDQISFLDRQCGCGRHMQVMSNVSTKSEDMVRTADGREISPSILTHPFKPFSQIEKSQIIQEDVGHLRVLIVLREGDFDDVADGLRKGLHDRLGSEMQIDFEKVDDIQRASSGKYRWVVSKLNS